MQSMLLNLIFWVCVPPLLGLLAYLVYYLFSLPLRRQERARLFLDVLEVGLRRGHTPESVIRSASENGDHRLGVRFHMLAAWLASGLRLDQALDRVPRLLPPSVVATLRIGRELGDLRKVLGACRQQLEDGVSKVFQAQHYLVALLLMAWPTWLMVFFSLTIFVLPRFEAIMMDMGASEPPQFHWLVQYARPIVLVQGLIAFVFYGGGLVYVGGPRLARWVNMVVPGLADLVAYATPWRRKRMQRDYSAMLCLLLDADVPEARAVRLAAETAANRFFMRRADRVATELERGTRITAAVAHLDEAGEFRWRLENAAAGHARFLTALASWHEALSARAFQLEQTVAQVLTSGLVVINGVFVGMLAVYAFSVLIAITELALW